MAQSPVLYSIDHRSACLTVSTDSDYLSFVSGRATLYDACSFAYTNGVVRACFIGVIDLRAVFESSLAAKLRHYVIKKHDAAVFRLPQLHQVTSICIEDCLRLEYISTDRSHDAELHVLTCAHLREIDHAGPIDVTCCPRLTRIPRAIAPLSGIRINWGCPMVPPPAPALCFRGVCDASSRWGGVESDGSWKDTSDPCIFVIFGADVSEFDPPGSFTVDPHDDGVMIVRVAGVQADWDARLWRHASRTVILAAHRAGYRLPPELWIHLLEFT